MDEELTGSKQPFPSRPSLECSYKRTRTMDRTRNSDRSALIRTSMLLFALLAVASFALARVVA